MLILALLILYANDAGPRPVEVLELKERCSLLEATMLAGGDVVYLRRTIHVRPFVDEFSRMTSRAGKTWIRVKVAQQGGWMFREGESCRPELVLAREPPARFDPNAPQEIVEIEFLDPIRRIEGGRFRFIQRMATFNVRPGFGAAKPPTCYVGELSRSSKEWTARVLKMKLSYSPTCS